MNEDQSMEFNDLAGIYQDIAEIIGIENVYLIYKNLKGQQVTFPKKLYTTEYILKKVINEYNGKNIKQLAVKYDYTERYLRKLLREYEESTKDEKKDME